MAVRRVRRIIRRFDPWTVLKVALVFNALAGLIFLLGTRVAWELLQQKGVLEELTERLGELQITLVIDGSTWGRVVVFLTIVWATVSTAAMTLGAVMYNLIADLVGGVELSVLEESYNDVTSKQEQRVRSARVRPSGKSATSLRNRTAGKGSSSLNKT